MTVKEGGRSSGRGFASMNAEKQREIARKGGRAVSRDRTHMAAIGRKGGMEVSKDRQHMAEIGRKGGEASHGNRKRQDSPGNGEDHEALQDEEYEDDEP